MELKKDIKSELEKIKQMSGKDRIWYIYEYYKFHIVAVILAFTLLWVVGSSLYRQTFTTRLTFAIVNDRSGGESSMDRFENSLKEALGFGKKDLIEINSGLFINADGSQSSEYSYASMAKIAALAAGGDLDIIIADAKTLEHYESQGAFLDLKEFLPQDLLERAEKEDLFFYTDNEKGAVNCCRYFTGTYCIFRYDRCLDPAALSGSYCIFSAYRRHAPGHPVAV